MHKAVVFEIETEVLGNIHGVDGTISPRLLED